MIFMMITGVKQFSDLAGIIMTRAISGPAEAGLFQAPYQLSTIVLFGLGAITVAINPYLTQLHETKDRANLARLARRSAQAATAFAVVMAALIFLFGEWVIIRLYGEEFAGGYDVLMIVTLAYLIQASTGSSTALLSATGHEKNMLRISFATLAAGIFTSALCIPLFGGVGAALGVVASIFVLNVCTWWRCRTLLGVDTFFIPVPMRD
jgi:O-antigen/teichoic acid export membrane protein